MKFCRVLSDGSIQIALVRITQKKRRSKKQSLLNRRETIRVMRSRGFFRTVGEARGFAQRPIATAIKQAFGV